jgi:DNA modification methylase
MPERKNKNSGELPIETEFRLKQERAFEPKKSAPVERPEISFIEPPGPDEVEIPEQKQHFDLPVRFGAVPVDKAPLGWEVETRRAEFKVTKFQHAYPTIRLPFQEVQRVEFGHNKEFLAANEKDPKLRELFPTGANRLFFGDNLHIMRQLPSNSIDLFYIDPPFFSGRNYNVIFGDKNEVRSFTDIWEGGMPGYLVWLNARLWEMKRLLKPTGSIFVHLDWHAAHYVKVEMDKIFGYDRFLAEIVWHKNSGSIGKTSFSKRHDVILQYAKGEKYYYDGKAVGDLREQEKGTFGGYFGVDEDGREYREVRKAGKVYKYYMDEPRNPEDVWEVAQIPERDKVERIGYPTQKPIELLQRIIDSSCPPGGVVADFFMGGGTTCFVASGARIERETVRKQKRDGTTEEHVKRVLKFNAPARRWIACDQSRIAVAITADRVARFVEEGIGRLFPVPDFTVEHWGIYEAPKLEKFKPAEFREFVVKAFGGRPESVSPAIHGVRYGVPLFVGEPQRGSRIGKDEVAQFAKAVYEERRANHGVMLGWNFGPDARKAAEILAARENKRIDFVRLNLVRLESDEFREHVVSKHKDYGPLLSFIQPPEVRVTVRRVGRLKYQFDVSESVSLNKDGAIANVQWDFDHRHGRFTSTQGYAFRRDKDKRPELVVEYEFPNGGNITIACSAQDDQGGERTVVQTVEVN